MQGTGNISNWRKFVDFNKVHNWVPRKRKGSTLHKSTEQQIFTEEKLWSGVAEKLKNTRQKK